MKYNKNNTVLWVEAIGFLMIIVLSWFDEVVQLPQRLFGPEPPINWHESTLETAIVLVVWSLVYFWTRRLIKRLHHLEKFLRICSWCRKVKGEQGWMPVEDYFNHHFETKTSHGICPECAKKVME